jgi:hypothetical protein
VEATWHSLLDCCRLPSDLEEERWVGSKAKRGDLRLNVAQTCRALYWGWRLRPGRGAKGGVRREQIEGP